MARAYFGTAVLGLLLTSSVPARADDAEDKAVKIVEKLGGRVTRDDKQPGKPVVGVDFAFSRVGDADLKELTALKSLNTLLLYETAVTDEGLKALANLDNLIELGLGGGQRENPNGPQVTNTGLKQLAGIKKLTKLYLRGKKITDASLTEVSTLKNLTKLSLYDAAITERGLKELAPLSSLMYLDLSTPQVTSVSLKDLAPLKNLNTLNFYLTPLVRDAGLKELAALPNLTTLHLSSTGVTDAGLKDLAALKSLRTLSTHRCIGPGHEGTRSDDRSHRTQSLSHQHHR
jgi:internalin A